MRPLSAVLVRLYPARWRARYGDEFAAMLEERPVGPFDVVDVLLGALDAHLHLRGLGAAPEQGMAWVMSVRVAGVAALVGAPIWVAGFVAANGLVGEVDPRTPFAVMVAGSLSLLVALVGLSAFQARVQPVLSWMAFAVPAIGTIGLLVGAVGVALGRDDLTDAFYFGLITFFVGSLLFAVATYVAAVLSRPAAVLLAAAPVLALAGGSGAGFGDFMIVAGLATFTLGWCALGVDAVAIDRRLAVPARAE